MADRAARRRLVDHLQRIVVDVRTTATSDQVLPALRTLARARAVIDVLILRLVTTGRAHDESWDSLGTALGVSPTEADAWYRMRTRLDPAGPASAEDPAAEPPNVVGSRSRNGRAASRRLGGPGRGASDVGPSSGGRVR